MPTLVVETGSGVTGANSYISLADATSYLAVHSLAATWTGLASDDLRNEALIKATRYIEARFGRRFLGHKALPGNALSWPRLAIYDELAREQYAQGTIPDLLKNAQCEYAVRAATQSLMADTSASADTLKESKKLGPLEKSVEYAENTVASGGLVRDSQFRRIPDGDLLMEQLLRPAGDFVLQRA